MRGLRSDWRSLILRHCQQNWNAAGEICPLPAGPIDELPLDFSVLRFPARENRGMWTYATCCMSQPEDVPPIELHMFSPHSSAQIVELLVATAHYHRTDTRLGLGHTVNFGRPWLESSACTRGLVSLPYLDGPSVETLGSNGHTAKFFWLIPITLAEVEFKRTHGLDALERRFDEAPLAYLNPDRASVI